MALLGQVQLGGHGVDGIYDDVGFKVKNKAAVFGQIELLGGLQVGFGVNGAQAGQGSLALRAAHHIPRGQQLAVQVGLVHRVVIHQQQMAHPGTAQGLGGIAAHSA